MYTLHPASMQEAMDAKGFQSIGELAQTMGVHRNTIHHYLSGKGVFPKHFETLLETLDVRPEQVLVKQEPPPYERHQEVASIVDALQQQFNVSVILFGSRARGKARKYSDWDLGIFRKDGIEHREYLRIVRTAKGLCEDTVFFIDVVNLNKADPIFLKKIARDWQFMAGRQQDWIELQRRADDENK